MAEAEIKTPENPEAQTPPKKRVKSAGEKVFDRTVYTGIGFGVNEASSLWITDQFMHGKNLLRNVPGLKKAGEWFSETGFNRVSESIAKKFKLTEKLAKDGGKILPKERGGNALLMVTLLSGGTLLILPMKWLEDNKNRWVKRANHMVDKMRGRQMTPEEVVARDTQVEQDIACTPRQSWPSMMLGRLIAISSSVSTGTFIMGPERNKKLMNWSEKAFTGNIQPKGQKNAAHRYARLISVETYSCAISSIILEITSKLFAKRSSNPHDPEICKKTVEPAAPAAPVTTDSDTKTGGACNTCGGHAEKIQAQKAKVASLPAIAQI